MASKRGTSIIDWLSEVEASGNTQEASLSSATPSPSSSPSAFSSPSLAGLLPPRKRKLDPSNPQPSTENLALVKRTRKALREIMMSPSKKRARLEAAGQNDVQGELEHSSTQTPTKGQPSASSQVNLQTPEPSRPSTSSRSEPETPMSSRRRAEPSLAANVHNTKRTLERNGMWFNDKDAFDKYSDLKDKIAAILTNAPRSAMADASAKKVLAAVEQNYTQNEKTLFRKVQPLIVTLTRRVAGQENSEASGGIDIVKREYKEDGLEVIEDCNFTKKLLPLPDVITNDKEVGLTEPKPDFTYGIVEPERSPSAEVHVPKLLQAYLGVAPGMRFPFYVEEYKSAREGIIMAEHQAMRDGATLVNARRKLNQALEPDGFVSPAGADLDSFVFSCAWTPNLATIFVNWYEKTLNGEEIFHMKKVTSTYRMDEKDDVIRMRHDVHDILDWGVLEHKQKAEKVWKGIVDHYLQKYNSSKAGG